MYLIEENAMRIRRVLQDGKELCADASADVRDYRELIPIVGRSDSRGHIVAQRAHGKIHRFVCSRVALQEFPEVNTVEPIDSGASGFNHITKFVPRFKRATTIGETVHDGGPL